MKYFSICDCSFILAAMILAASSAMADEGPQENSALIHGEYSVPVKDPELVPYSRYPVGDVCLSHDGNDLVLEYSLPQELTGLEKGTILLKGQDDGGESFQLRGHLGSAKCTRTGSAGAKNVNCLIRYGELNMDFDRATKLLTEEYKDPKELRGRIQVMTMFQHEPVGIIAFPVSDPAL